MKTTDYIAAVKSKLNIQSDYALAKALNISKQAVSRYSLGYAGFDDSVSMRVAEILDIHPGIVILDMHRERAKSDVQREVWMEISKGFWPLAPHADSARGALPA